MRASIADNVVFEQIVLEKLRICCSVAIPRHFLETSRVQTATDYASDALRVHLEGYLACSKWSETTKSGADRYINVPATWWDAFKLRYFSSWLLRRFPAIENKIHSAAVSTTVHNYWIYPEIPAGMQKNTVHNIAMLHRQSRGE